MLRKSFPLALLVLTACPKRNAIWLVPGSTADSLVFAIGKTRGAAEPIPDLGGLVVYTCSSNSSSGQHTVWDIAPSETHTSMPPQVTFGETPPGYVSRTAPEALRAGCYTASRGANVSFTVLSGGAVRETSLE
jgi:hypothetical protein